MFGVNNHKNSCHETKQSAWHKLECFLRGVINIDEYNETPTATSVMYDAASQPSE